MPLQAPTPVLRLCCAVATLLSLPAATGGETANPWDPGVEKPSVEALQSALYIAAVPAVEKAQLVFTVSELAGVQRRHAPVRGSLPFRRGELAGPAQLRLLDPQGQEVPVQGLVTSFWPEGTVRWLCLDFLANLKAKETLTYTLEFGTQVKCATRSKLEVRQADGEITVETGRMEVLHSFGYNGDAKQDFVTRYGLVVPVKAAPRAPFLYGGEQGARAEAPLKEKLTHGPSLSDEYGGGHGRAAGLLKISELVLDFEADPQDAGTGAHLPLTPRADPERISRSKALGHIGTYARAKALGFDTEALQNWASGVLDFPVLQHEANGMYGWVDWPDQADCNPPKGGKFGLILQGGVGWSNGERSRRSKTPCKHGSERTG